MERSSRTLSSYWREALFTALVCAYAGLSVVAYTDHPREPGPELTGLERAGLEVWRRNNCQACHQIHGFGGFLGPDLTNAVDGSRSDEEFYSLLTAGWGKMPALELAEEEQHAVLAFLRAIHRTGRSQPRPNPAHRPVPPILHWQSLMQAGAAETPSEVARRGCDVLTSAACGACHLPFMSGRFRAPDLTLAAQDRSPAYIGPLLATGRPTMPQYEFGPGEVQDLSEFLEWVARNRSELVRKNEALLQRDGFTWHDLPWWEYP